MSNLSATGTIVKITDRTNVSKNADKPFHKRELVIEIPDGNYPQIVQFEATQDRCDLLDNVSRGQNVTVHFNLRGREYDGKVFNSLNLWKVIADGAQPSQPQPASQPAAQSEQPANNNAEPPTDDSLPF